MSIFLVDGEQMSLSQDLATVGRRAPRRRPAGRPPRCGRTGATPRCTPATWRRPSPSATAAPPGSGAPRRPRRTPLSLRPHRADPPDVTTNEAACDVARLVKEHDTKETRTAASTVRGSRGGATGGPRAPAPAGRGR